MPKTEAREVREHFEHLAQLRRDDLAAVEKADADKLRHSNAEKLSQLDEKYGAALQPQNVMLTRIQCLIDWLIEDDEARVKFETLFEIRVGRLIDDATEQAKEITEAMASAQRQAVLLDGVPGAPPPVNPLFRT